MDELEVGELTTISATFRTAAGVLTNPTAVTLVVTDPSGNDTTVLQAALSNPSAGVWTYNLTVDEAGVWAYRFEGTGAVVAGETAYLLVTAEGGDSLTGPCDGWIEAADIAACHDTSDASAAVISQAIDAASDLLWRWSGYRYPGVCKVSGLRPCAQNAGGLGYASDRYSFGYGYGDWSWWPSWGSCGCGETDHSACGCSGVSEVRLGRSPILSVTQVKVDGVVLTPGTDYRVDDHEYLVRLPRTESWPCCQRVDLPDTEPDTFSVSFYWGRNPPPSGKAAAVELAWAYIKTCADGDCAPPANASTVARQGTSISFINPERFGWDSFGNLKVGITAVDRFLSAVPKSRPAVIVSAGIGPDARRVAT